MKAISIDGTVLESDRIELKEAGVDLQKRPKKKSGSGGQYQTVGFLPYKNLMYVVPDDVVHNADELELEEFPAQSHEPEPQPQHDEEEEIPIIFDENVPEDEREQVLQELEEAEEEARSE